MFNWLHKLMSHPDAGAPVPITRPAPPDSTLAPATLPPAHDTRPQPLAFNVQTAATRWLFGLPPTPGTAGANGLTLELLADMLERMSLETTRAADWVPRVPAVLPKLLRGLRDEHSSAHDLATLIEQDVTLLAEALREVNSAFHQRSTPVTRTEDAVHMLGNQGIRLLLAKVAFRPVVGPDAGPLTHSGAPRIWSLSDTCAQASRALAGARGVDPFEAFLAGLAYNVGPLAALRMADKMAHLARPDPHGLGPRKVPVGEAGTAGNDQQTAQDVAHVLALLSHRVAARWELPENVIGAITGQIDPLAQRRWPQATELLAVAQETARLKALHDANWLPAPLEECWLHLPDDARQWLAESGAQSDLAQSSDTRLT